MKDASHLTVYEAVAAACAATFARYLAEGWPAKVAQNTHLIELAEARRDAILEEELCSRGYHLSKRERADWVLEGS